MKKFKVSQRLDKLPPYLFVQIDRKKQALRRKGIKLIDLSIGDPDICAPTKVIKTLCIAAKLKGNQKYALDQGKHTLRKAISKWFKKRFEVSLDENKEILPLIGSKEGLVHFPLGFVDSSDYCLVPNPAYPGYRGAVILAGAKIYDLPLLERDYFLPRLQKIPLSVRNKTKLLYLNYPNNPTTALAPKSFLQELVRFCCRYGIIIVYDNAYSEVYFKNKPLSIFQIQGAKEVAIEFHSFSKTFCMTGFRIGWACGNQHLIQSLLKVKTNIDSGIFGAVQDAATVAIDNCTSFTRQLRGIIRERRDLFLDILKEAGFNKVYSDSTFYLWAKIPRGAGSSIEFSKYLLSKKNIVATPGVGFGRLGEGFIRFALTVDRDILKKTYKLLTS